MVSDAVVQWLDSMRFYDGIPKATFVKRVEEAQEALDSDPYDVLSLDYNLDWIGAGTTQPLVDWLIEPEQRARFADTMHLNVHSNDYVNSRRIASELHTAGYTVSTRSIS